MSRNLNLPLFERNDLDRRTAVLEVERQTRERFTPRTADVTQDSAAIFGHYVQTKLTPEQWAARLALVTAFAEGRPVYYEEYMKGRVRWVKADKLSFIGPIESYSLDPNRSHLGNKEGM